MNKLLKRCMVAGLTGALMFSMTACGKNTSKQDTAGQKTSTQQSTAASKNTTDQKASNQKTTNQKSTTENKNEDNNATKKN